MKLNTWNPYLQSYVQSLGDIEFLKLHVILGKMLFHRYTDKIIILGKERESKTNILQNSIKSIADTFWR